MMRTADKRLQPQPAHQHSGARDKQRQDGPLESPMHHQQRSKRDRRTDLTEETRCGLGDSASDEPAGDVVVHVMMCQTEKRDDNDEPAEYRQHGLAADEALPAPLGPAAARPAAAGLPRYLAARPPGLGETDGDGLFSALHLLARTAGPECPLLLFVHRLSDLGRSLLAVVTGHEPSVVGDLRGSRGSRR